MQELEGHSTVSPTASARRSSNRMILEGSSARKLVGNVNTVRPAANDTLYTELETRYGGSYAQWIADRLEAFAAREKAEG